MLSGQRHSKLPSVAPLTAAALVLTFFPISLAAAEPPDRIVWSQAGWRVAAMTSNARVFVGCYAERTYFTTSNPNATWRVLFANYRDNRWAGIIGGTNTHIVANRRLNLAVDGKVVLATTPTWIDADNARLGAMSFETIDAISAGSMMEIVTASGRQPLGLDGSTPALAKVVECVATGLAAEVVSAQRSEPQTLIEDIRPATRTPPQDFSHLLAWNAREAKPLPVPSSTAVQRSTETQRVPLVAPDVAIVAEPAALLVGIRDAVAPASGTAVVTPFIDHAMIAHQAKVDELNSAGGGDSHWYDNIAAIVAVLVFAGVFVALAVFGTAMTKTRTRAPEKPMALITTDLIPLRPKESGAGQASSGTATAPQPTATFSVVLGFGRYLLGLLAIVGLIFLQGAGQLIMRMIMRSLGLYTCLAILGIVLAMYLLIRSTKQLRGRLGKSLAVTTTERRLWCAFSLLWMGSALLVAWAFEPLGRYWFFWEQGIWLKFFLLLFGPPLVSLVATGLYKWAVQRPVAV